MENKNSANFRFGFIISIILFSMLSFSFFNRELNKREELITESLHGGYQAGTIKACEIYEKQGNTGLLDLMEESRGKIGSYK
jgi:hypothetical protein